MLPIGEELQELLLDPAEPAERTLVERRRRSGERRLRWRVDSIMVSPDRGVGEAVLEELPFVVRVVIPHDDAAIRKLALRSRVGEACGDHAAGVPR